jgi:hypothetical protein
VRLSFCGGASGLGFEAGEGDETALLEDETTVGEDSFSSSPPVVFAPLLGQTQPSFWQHRF